jgi:tetratricopeptide (TPR) repeat protein
MDSANNKSIYRYPGITPFSEKDKDVFFGRDTDIDALYNSILLNQCTVISGKSGVGKTSLIYAGLKPQIENKINKTKDDRYFTILTVRVGVWTSNETETLVDKVKRYISADGASDISSGEFLSFLPGDLKNSLWFKLKQLQFQSFKKSNRIFLLIFDQLEELFTYPFQQFKDLLKEFKQIMINNLPDAVREAIEDVDKTEDVKSAHLRIAYNPIPVKLLLAIRSDKLNLLNRLREAIPNIFQNPVELRPLSREQATKAIKEPSGKKGDFITDAFEIEDETVAAICDFLESQQSTDLDSNFEEWHIEPFTLQILCQHIERNIVPYDQDKKITRAELGDPDEIIKNYYQDVLNKLQLDEQTKLNVRKLIEEEMIYEPDQRRLILYKEIIVNEFNISEELLNKLTDAKLLRELIAVGSKPSYEISHDWMVIPILNAKKERLGQSNQERFNSTIEELEKEVKKNPNDYSLYKRIGDYYYFLQDYKTAINKYSQAIKKKEQLGIKGGDTELYFNRANSYLKLKEYLLSNNDLAEVLAAEPNHLLANYYTAYNYHMSKNFELAKEYYHKVLELDGAYGDAFYNLGLVYQDLNDLQESYQNFKKATQLNTDDYEAFYRLAVLCVEMALREQNEESKNLLQKEAIEYFTQSITLKPDYVNAYIQLAYLYHFDLKQSEDAIHTLNKLIDEKPAESQAWVTLGMIYREIKKYAEAQKSLFRSISLAPDNFLAYYYLGLIANDQGKHFDAILFLNKCLKYNADYVNAYIEKAYAHRMLQEIEQAVYCYKKILEIEPGNKTALEGLKKINEYSEGEIKLRENVQNNPEDVTSLVELGILSNNKAQYEEAIDWFIKALKLEPENTRALIEIAYAHSGLNQYEKSIEYYNKILEVQPLNHTAHYAIAECYERLNQPDKAIPYLKKATELDPQDHESFYKLGILLNNKNEFEEAINALNQTLNIMPNHIEAMTEKGYAFLKLGKTEDALKCYKDVLEVDPNDAIAYYQIGLIYNSLNDIPQAVYNFSKAAEKNPQYYEANFQLGFIAHTEKNYAKAISYFEKCLQIQPQWPQAYEYIAYYYQQANDFTTAIKYYRKLLELNPNSAYGYRNLGYVLYQTNRLNEALTNLENAIKLAPNDELAKDYYNEVSAKLK